MPKYFLCEAGPMGGCTIVGVADEYADIMRIRGELLKKRKRPLWLYVALP